MPPAKPHPCECPNIDRSIDPNQTFNKPLIYHDDMGDYVYYLHYSGFEDIDGTKPKNVQFCKKIGRKTDIFQCLNISEWQVCPYYQTQRLEE